MADEGDVAPVGDITQDADETSAGYRRGAIVRQAINDRPERNAMFLGQMLQNPVRLCQDRIPYGFRRIRCVRFMSNPLLVGTSVRQLRFLAVPLLR